MRGFLRLLGWAALTVSLLLAVTGGGAFLLFCGVTQPGPLAEARTVIIPRHSGLGEIASLLAENGVIRHSRTFELGTTLSGRAAALLAGEYEFPASASPLQAMDILAAGKTVKHRLV